jgi:hypothetical protein
MTVWLLLRCAPFTGNWHWEMQPLGTKHSISCFRFSDDNTVTAVQEQRGGKGTMDEPNVETLR